MEIQAKELKQALDQMRPFVSRKGSLPVIINRVLVDGHKIVATDLEKAVAIELQEVRGGEGERFLLPYREVSEVLKNTPGYAWIGIDISDQWVTFKMPRATTSWVKVDPADYPPLPDPDFGIEDSLNGDVLTQALTRAVTYTASDDKRPVLTGVSLRLGEPIEVAGADGFRLAVQELPLSFPLEESKQLIVPRSTVAALGHVWAKSEHPAVMMGASRGNEATVSVISPSRPVWLAYSDATIRFRWDRVTVLSQLLQGTFPNYQQLIPKEHTSRVTFDPQELHWAVRQMDPVAVSGIVHLSWERERLFVRAGGEDGTAQVDVWAELEGDEGRIALNKAYLHEFLRGKVGLVHMRATTPSSPVLMEASGGHPAVLAMPMFIKDEAPVERSAEPSETPEEAGEVEEKPAEPPKARRRSRR